MTVIPGPALETIFQSGFETTDTGGANVVTFTINQPVENDSNGSALDLATGFYNTYNGATENFNPYNSGGKLTVYWYDNALQAPFDSEVGGVVDATGAYLVLQGGTTVGPPSLFANGSSGGPGGTGVSGTLTNWLGGVDGYIGIAFLNSQTNQLNYGYIHMKTTGTKGFPAQVLDYGFDSTGAAIEIP
jgi:hypothetical protein